LSNHSQSNSATEFSKTPAFQASRLYSKASYKQAFFQFGNSIILYALVIWLMFESLSIHYGLTLALALVANGAYTRLFMIGHDCGHGSYLPKKWQNTVLGEFIGILTNTPLHYWAKQHMVHHRTTGNLDNRGDGDVVTMTIEEYEQATLWEKFSYRVYRNPFFLLLIAAPLHFVVLQRVPLGDQWHTREGWLSVMGTNIGIVIYYGSMIAIFGLKAFLLVYVPVVLLSSITAVWLFYVQHQFDGAYWRRAKEWTYHDATLQGSSFYNLPKWLHWYTGNIGYHHIHHLNPRVPNYKLAECFETSKDLQSTNSLGIVNSLSAAFLALWDESNQRLISFSQYKKQS
jgi:omega-6 fatty acid desaturase (delta-12 desaturase)